jgi:hypothetical protein
VKTNQFQKPFFEQAITLTNNKSRLLITDAYRRKLKLLNRKKDDIEKVIFDFFAS